MQSYDYILAFDLQSVFATWPITVIAFLVLKSSERTDKIGNISSLLVALITYDDQQFLNVSL